jgi:hypothetical protein
LLGLAALGAAWFRHSQRALDIPAGPATVVAARDAAADQNLLSFPDRAGPPGNPIPGWAVHLGHRRKQAVTVAIEGEQPLLVLESRSAKDFIALRSEWIPVQPGMKIQYEALLRKSTDFDGQLLVALSLRREAGDAARETELFNVIVSSQKRKEGWLLFKATVESVPAEATAVRLVLRGEFTGRAECRDFALRRRSPAP